MQRIVGVGFAAALIGAVVVSPSAAGTFEVDGAAIASDRNDDQWLSYGRNYSEQRFSPLEQIDKSNVGRLGLAWYLEVPDARSLVATPLAVDGVLYFTTSWSVVYAVDGVSGKVLWTFDPESRSVMAKSPGRMQGAWGTNRGVAFWKGKVYVGTTDGRLIALAADTGKVIWSVQTLDPESTLTITGAPRAFNGKVAIGFFGGDVGATRGYITAYDAETGKQVWRFYTVPGDPAKGFENDAMQRAAETWSGEWWKFGGGGAVWNAITYDPDFNRVYIGTGNAEPWNGNIRNAGARKDNLYTSSIVALDADTGQYAWHYQVVPGDAWDYDAATDIVLADLNVNGGIRKILMQASKNGFFYVIDRSSGKLLSAAPFGHVTWADHIDLASGRPVEAPGARYEKKKALVWPGPGGAHSWHPMSYSPGTGLAYIPTIEAPGVYSDGAVTRSEWRPTKGSMSSGLNTIDGDVPANAGTSALVAWDPVKQQAVWKIDLPGAWPAGTLVTKGHLVFSGDAAGRFSAYADDTGAKLWDIEAGRGIVAAPITYAISGKQYVSILVDWSDSAGHFGGSVFAKQGWTYNGTGRRLLTFALDGKATLPAAHNTSNTPVDVGDFHVDPDKEMKGSELYGRHCLVCHGFDVRSGGATPDLRSSVTAANLDALKNVVLKGAMSQSGMPSFPELTESDVEAIYTHIRARARAAINDQKR